MANIRPSTLIHRAQNIEMQSCYMFTFALTLIFISLHVFAQENKQVPTSGDSLDDPPCTLVQQQMSTSGEDHSLCNITQDYATLHSKDTVIKELTSTLKTQKSDVTSEVESLINSTSDNVMSENIAKILSGLTATVTQNNNMLTKILSMIELHDSALANSTQKLSCEIAQHNLPMATLNGRRYYFSESQPAMSWYQANDFCQSHGMQLVSVETQEEWDLIKPEVKNLRFKFGNWPWSSGSDAAEEGKWKWTATGSDIIFYGRRSTVDVDSRNCLFFNTEYWVDCSCSEKLSFICEVNTVC